MLFPLSDINPTKRLPLVNYLFIFANIAVFVITNLLQNPEQIESIVGSYGLVPINVTAITLVTSMFLHADLFHLIGNMWYLWIMGDNVEDKIGSIQYPAFYLLAGAAGALLHILTSAPESARIPMIGASGAISGVIGAYVALFPNAQIRCLLVFIPIIRIIMVRAFVLIGIWFLMQLIAAYLSSKSGVASIAYMAHIGGFAFGGIVGLMYRIFKHED